MSFALWTIVCLIGYGGGLVVLWRVTPLIVVRSYDEGLFMAIMALDIFGGIFAFGAVTITFALFSGNFPIRLLDFFLLLGILIVGARLAYTSFRANRHRRGSYLASRIVAGVYCLALALAALFYLVLLFSPVNPTP